MHSGRVIAKKVRVAVAVALVSSSILIAGAQPVFANTDKAATVLKSVESDLVATITAVDKMSFASAAAKSAYLSKQITALGKTEAGKYGSSLLGAVVFAVLVAQALITTNGLGGIHSCANPSCS